MVDFSKIKSEYLTEPPLLFNYTDQQLLDCVEGIDLPNFPELPAHSQNMERHVAGISEAAANAIGHRNMHALRLKTIKSREQVPTEANKSDFMEL